MMRVTTARMLVCTMDSPGHGQALAERNDSQAVTTLRRGG
jgi:hypothetical protein